MTASTYVTHAHAHTRTHTHTVTTIVTTRLHKYIHVMLLLCDLNSFNNNARGMGYFRSEAMHTVEVLLVSLPLENVEATTTSAIRKVGS